MKYLGQVTLAAFVSAYLSVPVRAADTMVGQPIYEQEIVSGKVRQEPDMGYVLVRGWDGLIATFLRVPDESERLQWEQERQAMLAKTAGANAKIPEDRQSTPSQGKIEDLKGPSEKFVSPSTDSAKVILPELKDKFLIGPKFRYNNDGKGWYFVAVKPGRYFWSSRVLGSKGRCYCMGTIAFTVKPGSISNLGDMLLTNAQQMGSMDAPVTLKGWLMEMPTLYAYGKSNNYFGLEVDRLALVPGVLSYRRDVVIDVRTGQALSNPKLVSMQKPKL